MVAFNGLSCIVITTLVSVSSLGSFFNLPSPHLLSPLLSLIQPSLQYAWPNLVCTLKNHLKWPKNNPKIRYRLVTTSFLRMCVDTNDVIPRCILHVTILSWKYFFPCMACTRNVLFPLDMTLP